MNRHKEIADIIEDECTTKEEAIEKLRGEMGNGINLKNKESSVERKR